MNRDGIHGVPKRKALRQRHLFRTWRNFQFVALWHVARWCGKVPPLWSFNNQLTTCIKQLDSRNFTTTRSTTFQLLAVFVFLFT